MKTAILVYATLLFLATNSHAQFNPSFEQYDSIENPIGWKVVSGTAKRHTVKLINNIPFAATQGNYYMQLTNDTLSNPRVNVILTNRFAFNDTPYSLYVDAFLIPSFASDYASVSILFKSDAGDTVLNIFDTLKPVTQPGNPSQILLKWNTYPIDLKAAYRLKQKPDSCILTLTNSASASGFATLFIDNLRFSSFSVGISDEIIQPKIDVFPNPSAGIIHIEGITEPCTITVYDLTGTKIKRTETTEAEHNMNLTELNTGIYLLNICGQRFNITRKICISR